MEALSLAISGKEAPGGVKRMFCMGRIVAECSARCARIGGAIGDSGKRVVVNASLPQQLLRLVCLVA